MKVHQKLQETDMKIQPYIYIYFKVGLKERTYRLYFFNKHRPMFDTKARDNQCDQLNKAEVRLVKNHWTETGNKLTTPELNPHSTLTPTSPPREEREKLS